MSAICVPTPDGFAILGAGSARRARRYAMQAAARLGEGITGRARRVTDPSGLSRWEYRTEAVAR